MPSSYRKDNFRIKAKARQEVTVAVVDYGPITVKAGTFDAFQIQRSWEQPPEAKGFTPGGEENFYYSPAAKVLIKYDYLRGRGRELIDYWLVKTEPPSPR